MMGIFAALSTLSFGYTIKCPDVRRPAIRPRDFGVPETSLIFAEPRRATFISDKPLTKRQRRRLRGRAKEARRQAAKPKRWWEE